jgi:hypothetical protein
VGLRRGKAGAMTVTAPESNLTPGPGQAPAGRPASQPLAPGRADLWRRWRGPVALVAVVLLGGIVIALLKPGAMITGYADPAGTGPQGAHALADILAKRGTTVVRVITPAAASAAAAGAAAKAGSGGVTLVITSPGLLTAQQLARLAQVPGDRVLVGPDRAALAALAPAVRLRGAAPVRVLSPGCRLTAARLAGRADTGGLRLALGAHHGAAALCYPGHGSASLVRYSSAGRVITVLGTGNPLTNGSLAREGNAALALNLLGARSRVVWLVPGLGLARAPASGQKSLTQLIPLPAYLVVIQLCIAVVLAALWRARRLGPLVAERLPVVVRASETVEGHARLYQSRRARDRAAAALRAATLARVRPALGLAPDAGPGEIVQALSARSGGAAARTEAMLFGPAPGDDAALVALADDLDALEREVRTP